MSAVFSYWELPIIEAHIDCKERGTFPCDYESGISQKVQMKDMEQRAETVLSFLKLEKKIRVQP